MALLEGKVALVTGGSYGIGLAAAQAFAEEGAVVYIRGGDEGRLNVAAKSIGAEAHAIKADSSELKDRKSRVNLLSPGSTLDTGTLEGVSDDIKQYVVGMIPLDAWGCQRRTHQQLSFWLRNNRRS